MPATNPGRTRSLPSRRGSGTGTRCQTCLNTIVAKIVQAMRNHSVSGENPLIVPGNNRASTQSVATMRPNGPNAVGPDRQRE